MAKAHYGSTPRAGYVTIYFTERETQDIADDANQVGAIIAAVTPEMTVKAAVLSIAFGLHWKARRCLRRGKCLAVTVAGLIPFPHEYTPGVDDIPPISRGYWS